jgi:MFS family permease
MLPPVVRFGTRMRDSVSSLGAVLDNRNLVWMELAWITSILAHWAFIIGVSVFAYEAGGEKAVGLIFLVRLIPAALLSPFAGLLGDRYPRKRVLFATNVVRAILIAAVAACVYLDTANGIVYALSVAATIATTPFRSTQAALTPTLARSPNELTAANAVASGVESIATFVGPAIGGLVLAFAGTAALFVLTALVLVASAVCVLLIRVERGPAAQGARGEIEAATIFSEAFAGFRTIVREPPLRVMMGLLTAQTLVAGAVQVYIVVGAIQLLDLGTGGVGYLNSAMGVGALIGAIAALSLTGAKRLSPAFMVGVVLMGLPIVGIGLWPTTVVAMILLGVFGFGSSIEDVAALTIVQRAVPDDVLARVFGIIQMLWFGSLGIGAALAPVLIAWLGLEGALVVTGAFLPVLVAISWTRVARIDAAAPAPDAGDLRILTSVPMFAPMPGASLEHLAARLVPLRLEPGSVVVREGDAGDRFYIVAEGSLEVSQDGEPISTMEAGAHFGEIALLRDVPRTATITARTPVVLYALDRDDFLAAVTGHPASAEAAESVVSARLAGVASTGGVPTTG